MGIFDITYSNIPSLLMPVRLRKPVHKAWLQALINGAVVPLYTLFGANRFTNVYYLKHTSQVCYIEAALNDAFDNTLRRIYISDPPYALPVYIYLDTEAHPVSLARASELGSITAYDAPLYLFTESEVGANVAGFIVWVPAVLGMPADLNLTNQLNALVNRYRLPSKSNWVMITY